MLIGFIIGYAVTVALHGVVAAFVFGIHHSDYGPKDEDTQFAAKTLLASPVWPLFWGKKLIILVATAAGVANKKEEA